MDPLLSHCAQLSYFLHDHLYSIMQLLWSRASDSIVDDPLQREHSVLRGARLNAQHAARGQRSERERETHGCSQGHGPARVLTHAPRVPRCFTVLRPGLHVSPIVGKSTPPNSILMSPKLGWVSAASHTLTCALMPKSELTDDSREGSARACECLLWRVK